MAVFSIQLFGKKIWRTYSNENKYAECVSCKFPYGVLLMVGGQIAQHAFVLGAQVYHVYVVYDRSLTNCVMINGDVLYQHFLGCQAALVGYCYVFFAVFKRSKIYVLTP